MTDRRKVEEETQVKKKQNKDHEGQVMKKKEKNNIKENKKTNKDRPDALHAIIISACLLFKIFNIVMKGWIFRFVYFFTLSRIEIIMCNVRW
jgi:Na+/citrate or Na+/malate symporter